MLEHSPLIDGQVGSGNGTAWEVRWNEGNSRTSSNIKNWRRIVSDASSKFSNFFKKGNLLLTLTIAGVILGIFFGCLARLRKNGEEEILLVSYPGELLMRLLKQLTLPLIVSSLITGISGLDSKSSNKMKIRALMYYFTTTVIAAMLGIVLVILIHPGDPSKKYVNKIKIVHPEKISTFDTFLDLGRNMFPDNLVAACFQQMETRFDKVYVKTQNMDGNDTSDYNETVAQYVRIQKQKEGMNILGIIVFCITFGTICGQIGTDGLIIIRFCKAINDIIMIFVCKVMWLMPLGIMSLICGKIMSLEDVGDTAEQLGMYLLTVITGLTIHSLVTLPAIFFLIVRKNPYEVARQMSQAIITALGTSSSAATLPVTFQCLENNLQLDKRVTRFVVPVGATINMDGTALYEAVAAIFIAQLHGIELSIQDVITISFTATAASLGAASMPSAGLVTMVIVLSAVHLPTKDVSLIFAVDWFLDRFRTAINVLGDAYGAGIVYHLSKAELDVVDEMNRPRVELEMTEGNSLSS